MHNICWFDGAAQNNGTLSGAGGIIKLGGTLSTGGLSISEWEQITGQKFLVCGPPYH
jgi:hypothetical protein